MEDVLEVYRRDYGEREVLVCLDETSKQLIQESRQPMTGGPGKVQAYDYEYRRQGVSNLFILFAPPEGWRRVEVAERRTRTDWAQVVRKLVDQDFPHKDRIVLVLDNLNTHHPASLYEAFEPAEAQREDYRTYPTEFAPFANTVQQSMMETVFLLIGFSGDDPNFVNWSGWVRDNLGASPPKIYLAGWLGLSPHRRRMLESNNVVRIDLAQHPESGQWPDNLRYYRSTEWLLHTLESERPYDITSWPTTSRRQEDEALEMPQSIKEAAAGEPKAEPVVQNTGAEPLPVPDDVREIIAIWRHNRMVYPGWLTMPPFNRRRLEVAQWIFQEGQDSHKEAIRQLVEDGLSYLAQELRYDREHENPDRVPRKRLYCVRLAVEMAKDGLDASPAVARWLDMAKEDPLPEVRAAIGQLGSG